MVLTASWAAVAAALMQGFSLSLGLIVAIGAQNAFVLRQGLRKEHLGSVVLFCALADAALILAGVFGLAQALAERAFLARLLALAGAVFLAAYGYQALMRMRSGAALRPSQSATGATRSSVLAQAAAFTFLNPHVYLDTVLLVGGLGAQQPEQLQGWFAGGACLASAIWFSVLGFGARRLAPWFASARVWQVLDGLIGLTMWLLAMLMLQHAL